MQRPAMGVFAGEFVCGELLDFRAASKFIEIER